MTKYKQGICSADIRVHSSEDAQVEEIIYEVEDSTAYVSRPDIHDALDLMADVTDALYEDGVDNINVLVWL